MIKKTLIFSACLGLSLIFTSCTPGERGAFAGGAIGAGTGAIVGDETGAIIGGVLGAVVGSEIAKDNAYYRDRDSYGYRGNHYGSHRGYCPPPRGRRGYGY